MKKLSQQASEMISRVMGLMSDDSKSHADPEARPPQLRPDTSDESVEVTPDPDEALSPSKESLSGSNPAPRIERIINIDIPGYKLGRELGRGGQAVVFEGVQKSTGQKVAVKILREGSLASSKELARFEREIQVLAALNHPNIVRVVDRGTSQDGMQYLVMAHIQGMPMDKWLKQQRSDQDAKLKPQQVERLLRLFLTICDAVNSAHLRGIVHRDLKPSNIIIDDRGEPHILDFGLARSIFYGSDDHGLPNAVSISGQFIGSVPWASPEQAQGSQSLIDSRTDVYSLGVILYQILTGEFPYQVQGSIPDVIKNIVATAPEAPSKRNLKSKAGSRVGMTSSTSSYFRASSVEVLDAIVLKALAKPREDRYQSAGELARDVANFISDRPTQAAGDRARGRRWRKYAVAAAITVAILAGVFAMGVKAKSWGQNPDKENLAAPMAMAPLEGQGAIVPPGSGAPVSIGIATEAAKSGWVSECAVDFAKTPKGRNVDVRVHTMSVTDSFRAVSDGDQRIHVLLPTNSMPGEIFSEEWRRLRGKSPVLRTERLATSPLVFLFTQRGLQAVDDPSAGITLRAVKKAHAESKLSFGYNHPMKTGSGLSTLALMAYDFYDKNRDLTPLDAQNPAFIEYLRTYDSRFTQTFQNSEALLTEIAQAGASDFDVILVPEDAVLVKLQQAPGRYKDMRVVYPDPTIWNDHPAYVLDVPWSSPDQRAAASDFIDYLLSTKAQAKALDTGLRPVNISVALDNPESPLVKYANHGIKLNLLHFCQYPRRPALEALQSSWLQSRPSLGSNAEPVSTQLTTAITP